MKRITILLLVTAGLFLFAFEAAAQEEKAITQREITYLAIKVSEEKNLVNVLGRQSDFEQLKKLWDWTLLIDTLRLRSAIGQAGRGVDTKGANRVLAEAVQYLKANKQLLQAVPPGELNMLDDPYLGETVDLRREIQTLLGIP